MKRIIIIAALALSPLFLTACDTGTAAPPTAAQQNAHARQTSVNNVMTSTRTPVLEHSIERDNIARRITRSNDANQIQWIYLFSDTGAVIERFAVVGKITSGGKRMNPSTGYKDVQIDCGQYTCDKLARIELPDEMGTYGHSNPYEFWFNLDGSMVQTNLKYVVLDKPVNIKGGVMRIQDVDQKELAEKRRIEAYLKKGMKLHDAVEAAK